MLETLFFSMLETFVFFRCSKLLIIAFVFSVLELLIIAFIRFDRSNSFYFLLVRFLPLPRTIKKCLRPQACPWRIRCPHRARHHESWWRGRSRDHGLWDGWHGARLRRPFFFRCQFYLSIYLSIYQSINSGSGLMNEVPPN